MATTAVKDEKCAICGKVLCKNDKEELLDTLCGHKYHVICVQKRRDKRKKMHCKVKSCRKESALQQALTEYATDVWRKVPRGRPDQLQSEAYTSRSNLSAVSNNTSLKL